MTQRTKRKVEYVAALAGFYASLLLLIFSAFLALTGCGEEQRFTTRVCYDTRGDEVKEVPCIGR